MSSVWHDGVENPRLISERKKNEKYIKGMFIYK